MVQDIKELEVSHSSSITKRFIFGVTISLQPSLIKWNKIMAYLVALHKSQSLVRQREVQLLLCGQIMSIVSLSLLKYMEFQMQEYFSILRILILTDMIIAKALGIFSKYQTSKLILQFLNVLRSFLILSICVCLLKICTNLQKHLCFLYNHYMMFGLQITYLV